MKKENYTTGSDSQRAFGQVNIRCSDEENTLMCYQVQVNILGLLVLIFNRFGLDISFGLQMIAIGHKGLYLVEEMKNTAIWFRQITNIFSWVKIEYWFR
jgi:hypothetical protein